EQLENSGISAEIIDLATISPIDMETILASVEKTGRCVIIHEAARTGGVGADISAQIAERALLSLKAPVQRLTGYDTVVPYGRLEKFYLPSEQEIIEAVKLAMEFA
ncbi:MAG TPA: transketolase C-terminal domain-containing protein, partial [Gammaproteobacteria bacterium]|nr:transketolase C-terminal domain-containing protein [Gammaproteobacteria bacterium]